MAITLGTFTKQGDASGYVGTLKTLNVTAALTIVPVDRASENAPDYRIYAGRGAPSFEVGAAWSQTAKSSGETYLNLKLAAPDYVELSVMRSGGVLGQVFCRFCGWRAPHNAGGKRPAAGLGTRRRAGRLGQRDQTRARLPSTSTRLA